MCVSYDKINCLNWNIIIINHHVIVKNLKLISSSKLYVYQFFWPVSRRSQRNPDLDLDPWNWTTMYLSECIKEVHWTKLCIIFEWLRPWRQSPEQAVYSYFRNPLKWNSRNLYNLHQCKINNISHLTRAWNIYFKSKE